jgi:hypothetical protein
MLRIQAALVQHNVLNLAYTIALPERDLSLD